LSEIIARNADAEYLAKCSLDNTTDHATFRAKVSIVSYEEL
jgi:hypothetical protein